MNHKLLCVEVDYNPNVLSLYEEKSGIHLIQIEKSNDGYWRVSEYFNQSQFKNLKYIFKIDLISKIEKIIF